MTVFKKIARALLFPPIAVLLVFTPLIIAFLVSCMVRLDSDSVYSILSYVLAMYALTVWCIRLPGIIGSVRRFKNENLLIQLWRENTRLRVSLSLYGSLLWNTAYAVFQFCLGLYHRSFWFFSLAGYYACLALMRFYLARHIRRFTPGQQRLEELKRYRACGVMFLVMNVALTSIVLFMVRLERGFHHHEIPTIAMAAYTFASFTMAVINLFRYRKYHSPVYTASKTISLAAACVSMLTLESTMLSTFQQGDPLFRTKMLGLTGSAVCAFIIVTALYMIIHSTREIKFITGEAS